MNDRRNRGELAAGAAVDAFGRRCPGYEDPGLALLGLLLKKFLEVHGTERMLQFCEGMARAEERRRRVALEQLRRLEHEHAVKGARPVMRRLKQNKEK